jgi:predicted Zn finger-like uncharacterized protein
MADEKFTRCPACRTIFRVTTQQLGMRGGQVRCGHCHTAFDGVAALISLEPRVQERTEPRFDEMELGPPTVTLRSAHALEPVPPEVEDKARPAVDQDAPDSGPGLDEAAYNARFSPQDDRRPRRLPAWVFGVIIPVLLLLLAAQAVFHFRDAIAAHWPVAKPALARLCATAGCELQPLLDIAGLSIEASDLQSDPAHRGLLILTATLRNRTLHSLGYPYLELTLTNTQEQTVVRRAFAPQEYAGGTADIAAGIAGNGEVGIKLFIDASATTQAGYQVYLFYP